jgi:hypothetical protein
MVAWGPLGVGERERKSRRRYKERWKMWEMKKENYLNFAL